MPRKTEEFQEVRLRLELAITYKASHRTARLVQMLRSGIRNSFPNKFKKVIVGKFKEEHAIFHDGKWMDLYYDDER